jgi:phosphonate transport system substrate-binding protein
MFVRKMLVVGIAVTSLLVSMYGTALAKDIVMGLIPAENNEEMVAKFEPMRAHLEKKLGQKVKLYTATDYSGVIEAMKKKRVDIAWFGPLSYVLAEQEAGAEAFAVGVGENGKSSYHSMITVPGDSPAKSLMDLKGKSMAFVDPASTSGSLMPSYMVKQATGMMPEQFFGKSIYAGSHDATQMAVKNKTVDAGAVADNVYEKMMDKGLITSDSNRVLLKSPAIPGSPLTYRKDLPAALKKQIQDAMVTAHNEIAVSGFGKLTRYEAATPADYQPIRDMVKELGLKKEQMLK